MGVFAEPGILETLNQFTLEEITQGIEVLENSIGRTRFGNKYDEQLTILYTLRGHAERKLLNYEISELTNQILETLLCKFSMKEARAKTFQILVRYQNQGQGNEFVRDRLKKELEKLQLVEV